MLSTYLCSSNVEMTSSHVWCSVTATWYQIHIIFMFRLVEPWWAAEWRVSAFMINPGLCPLPDPITPPSWCSADDLFGTLTAVLVGLVVLKALFVNSAAHFCTFHSLLLFLFCLTKLRVIGRWLPGCFLSRNCVPPRRLSSRRSCVGCQKVVVALKAVQLYFLLCLCTDDDTIFVPD